MLDGLVGGLSLTSKPGDARQDFKRHIAQLAGLGGADKRLPVLRRDRISVAPRARGHLLDAEVPGEVGRRGPLVDDVSEGLHAKNNTDCIVVVNTNRIGRERVAGDTLRIAMTREAPDPDSPSGRLRTARLRRYKSAEAFIAAHEDVGITISGYRHHENGRKGKARLRLEHAERYGPLLGVDPIWIMTGRESSATEDLDRRLERFDAMLPAPDHGPRSAGNEAVETKELVEALRELAGAVRALGEQGKEQIAILKRIEKAQGAAQVSTNAASRPSKKSP